MKYFSLILIFLAMFSCSQNVQNENVENTDATQNHAHQNSVDVAHDHADETNGLHLHDGVKWPADDATRSAFANMENSVNVFKEKKQDPDLNDYNWLGETLQKDLDVLFKSCTMEGEAHDQLHSLLELVIADVKSLKNTDVNEASEGYKNIPQHLQMFHEYFQ